MSRFRRENLVPLFTDASLAKPPAIEIVQAASSSSPCDITGSSPLKQEGGGGGHDCCCFTCFF